MKLRASFFILALALSSVNIQAQIDDSKYREIGFTSELIFISTTAQNEYQNSISWASSVQTDESLLCHACIHGGTANDSLKCILTIEKDLFLHTKKVTDAYQQLQVDYNAYISEVVAEMMVTSVPKAFRIFDESIITKNKKFNPYSRYVRAKYKFRLGKLYGNLDAIIIPDLKNLDQAYVALQAYLNNPSCTTAKVAAFDPTTLIPSVGDLYNIFSGIATTIQQNQKNRADELIGLLQSLELPATSGGSSPTASSGAGVASKASSVKAGGGGK